MPIQPCLFDLLIMASSGINTIQNVDVNDDIDYHTGEYVESVKPCDKEEEIAE